MFLDQVAVVSFGGVPYTHCHPTADQRVSGCARAKMLAGLGVAETTPAHHGQAAFQLPSQAIAPVRRCWRAR